MSKALRSASQDLQNNTAFREFTSALEEMLAKERDMFEHTSPASEFLRGRVSAMRDLLTEIKKDT